MARILFIDNQIPAQEQGAGFPRSYAILECLAELNHEIALYPLINSKRIEPHTSQLQQKGIEVIFNMSSEEIHFAPFYQSRKDNYDWVWISRPHNMKAVSEKIKMINPKQKIIYDAEALYALRTIQRLELYGTQLSQRRKNKMIRDEMNLMKHADVVVAVSEREKSMIRRFVKKRIAVVDHTVELQPTTKTFEDRKDLLFVGRFSKRGGPNDDAILHFAKEIYPTVQKETGAKLWIVGTNDNPKIKDLSSDFIRVTGRTDQLWDYYNHCRVFVVPTRFAAGIPLKMLECLSHGLPAVVTPLIAEQLNLNDELVFVGKNTEDFIRKVIDCYSQEKQWNNIRENGLEWIKKRFSREVFLQKIRNLNLDQR